MLRNFIRGPVFMGLMLLTFTLSLNAQNGAFSFDGVDDFIVYRSIPEFADLETANGSTIEISFQINSLNSGAILFAQHNEITGESNGIGFTSSGSLYSFFGEEIAEEEGITLEPGVCYLLSVVYESTAIRYYLNGVQVMVGAAPFNFPVYLNNQPFYLGHSPAVNGSYFEGVMNEVRIFGDQRTASEIAANVNSSIDYYNDHIFACFDFDVNFDNYTAGRFGFDHVLGNLGNGVASHEPTATADECLQESNFESVSSADCQNPVQLVCNNTRGPNELLCNGNFDQYCAALLPANSPWNGNFPNGLYPHHAFQRALNPIYRNTAPGTDVPNWFPVEANFPAVANQPTTSPDIFVPNGLGSEAGSWDITWSGLAQYGTPPTLSWYGDPGTSGMIGMLGSSSTTRGEGVWTTLSQSHVLLPGTNYIFSGWFYLSEAYIYQPTGPGEIEISFNNGTNEYIAATAAVQFWDDVPTNNGWQHITISFQTPATLPSGMTTFSLRHSSTQTTSFDYYLWADDLSLVQATPSNVFPQYLFAGEDYNDFHHHLVRVDANDDVYALISVESQGTTTNPVVGHPVAHGPTAPLTNQKGTILVKYNTVGDYLWHQYYDGFQIVDLDFDQNGDIVAVGHSAATQASPYSGGTVSTVSCILPNNAGSYPITPSLETHQLVFARISGDNGVVDLSNTFSRGYIGYEAATGVAVIGNMAYLTCELQENGNCTQSQIPLIWASQSYLTSTILAYDLVTNTEVPPGFNIPVPLVRPRSIKKDGQGGFFVLTDDYILHAPTTATQTTLTATPLQTPNPTYLEPQSGTSNAFVLYKDERVVELYNATTGFLNRFGTPVGKKPIAATSSIHGDYIMYYLPSSASLGQDPNPVILSIEKLDPNGNFGSTIWTRESVTNYTGMINSYVSSHYDQVGDLVHFNNQTNRMVFTGAFEYYAPPPSGLPSISWVLQFGSRGITAPAIHTHGHAFVSTVEDFGNTSVFFKNNPAAFDDQSSDEETEDFLVDLFPNPAKRGEVEINSNQELQSLNVFGLDGSRVLGLSAQEINNPQSIKLDVSHLESGIYMVQVISAKDTKVIRLLIN